VHPVIHRKNTQRGRGKERKRRKKHRQNLGIIVLKCNDRTPKFLPTGKLFLWIFANVHPMPSLLATRNTFL